MIDLSKNKVSNDFFDEYLNPSDEKIYEWEITSLNSPIEKIGYSLFYIVSYSIVLPGLSWGLLKLISLLSSVAALVSGIAMLFLIAREMRFLARSSTRFPKFSSQKQLTMILYSFLTGNILYLLTSINSPFLSNYFITTANFNTIEWVKFLLYQALNLLLLDIPETFNFNFSNIMPISTIGKTISVLTKVIISWGIIKLAINVYISINSSKKFYGKLEDCIKECKSYLGFTNSDLVNEEAGWLRYRLIRRSNGENGQDIMMIPIDFLEWIQRSGVFDEEIFI